MNNAFSKAAAGTFKLNKVEAIHRWYSYLEGYSSCLIDNIIEEIGTKNIHSVYDPFCGTGTTALVASNYGMQSYYSETNPFMRDVIEAKINCVKRLRESGIKSKYLGQFLDLVARYTFQFSEKPVWDGFEKYYDSLVLQKLLELRQLVNGIEDEDTKRIALVILASVCVRSSKMIRQGDLRFAKESEKSDKDQDIVLLFSNKLNEAIADIEDDTCPVLASTICIADDARDVDSDNLVNCIITSPPYLNGTNYVRNTKLELKLFDYVSTENDLPLFHSKGIIAGINNVSKRKGQFTPPGYIIPYLSQLEPVSYDKRIPVMIAGYFYDMEKVIMKLSQITQDHGYFIMDIGDSQFAGIHIPTHEILSKICADHGFMLYDEEVLRKRRSKNGMVLTQRLLKFRLNKEEAVK